MTDNEIIKALECCSVNINVCDTCPIDPKKKDNYTCGMVLTRNALDLINRQTAEIDFYKERSNKYEAQVEVLLEQTKNQKAEIEKFDNIKATINKFWDMLLKCKIAKRKDAPTLEEFAEVIGEIETDAIKEFAERLKPMMFGYYDCLEQSAKGRPYEGDTLMDYEVVDMVEDCIDNLVKEMVGE